MVDELMVGKRAQNRYTGSMTPTVDGDTANRGRSNAGGRRSGKEARTRGIRFRISLLFLVLALNSVALVALSVGLITNLAVDVEQGRRLRAEIVLSLDELHRRALREAVLAKPVGAERIAQDLLDVERRLLKRGDAGKGAARAVQNYGQAVAAWRKAMAVLEQRPAAKAQPEPSEPLATGQSEDAPPGPDTAPEDTESSGRQAPEDTESSGRQAPEGTESSGRQAPQSEQGAQPDASAGSGDVEAPEECALHDAAGAEPEPSSTRGRADAVRRQVLQLVEIESRRREVIEAVALLPDVVNPAWLEAVIPLVPWGFVWVVALTLLTLFQVYRLRAVLTDPLEQLTAAAAAISAGELHRKMPQFRGTWEIEDLAKSAGAMRDQLVESIDLLDARNRQISTILENLEDGVLHVDAEGRIREFNARAARILAQHRDLVLAAGQTLAQLLPGIEEGWFAAGERREREIVLKRGDAEVGLEIRSGPVEPTKGEGEGEAAQHGHVVVIRDVTHRREIERLKRDFMSVVTHELKTPLTSIEGYTKLLLMGKGGSLSERQRSILTVIAEQSEILKNMIQDLLDIRRMEIGQLPLRKTEIRLGDILDSAHQAHTSEAKTRGLRFELRVDPSAESVSLHVDPFRMQQVVSNLLQNAFKFTPSGGAVVLAAGRAADGVWFSVSDTGSGIPRDALPRLFDRFFQVDSGDIRISRGVGLGLYISRELVNAHGGAIEVVSAEGEGSTFTVRLPVAGSGSSPTGEPKQP